jgi:hypothetical protein
LRPGHPSGAGGRKLADTLVANDSPDDAAMLVTLSHFTGPKDRG